MEFEANIKIISASIHAVAILLNGAIFGAICKKSLFRCPSNRFVLSLASCHILTSTLTLLISLSTLIDSSMSSCLDSVILHVTFGAGLVNSFTLTAISCERYITIARPMRFKSIVTTQRCSLILIFLWLLSTFVTAFPLLLFSPSPSEPVDVPYFSIVFTTVTLFSLVVMCGCYYIIFTIAKEKCQHVQIGQFTSSISSDWPSSAYPSQAEGQKQSSLLQHVLKANARHVNSIKLEELEKSRHRRPVQNSPRKTIGTIISLLSSLLLTQLPISFSLIQRDFLPFALLFLAISGITNPFLYGFLNRKIRRQLRRMFAFRTKKSRRLHFCGKPPSIYSEFVREIAQAHGAGMNVSKDQLGEPEKPSLPQEDVRLPDPIHFPRKDSQDSGADMTFSDEEEEPRTEPNVFTICSQTISTSAEDVDDHHSLTDRELVSLQNIICEEGS